MMICGKCKTRTDDKESVKACFAGNPHAHVQSWHAQPTPPPEPEPEETYAQRYERRTKSPDLAFPTAMAWKVIPEGKTGYFAARVDDNHPYEFFRFSKPKDGKYKGVLKIQTIHGDNLKMFLIIRSDGSHWAVEHQRPRFEDALTMAVIDPRYAQKKFGEIAKRCCNCGKGLTDDRSLWYGIGPECEEYRPDIIAVVIDEKGEYAGPQGISA